MDRFVVKRPRLSLELQSKELPENHISLEESESESKRPRLALDTKNKEYSENHLAPPA